jgi:hypothetical protein
MFGEAAFFGQARRSADVAAVSNVDLYLLRPSLLEESDSDLVNRLRLQLYLNLAELGFYRLRAVNKILVTRTIN